MKSRIVFVDWKESTLSTQRGFFMASQFIDHAFENKMITDELVYSENQGEVFFHDIRSNPAPEKYSTNILTPIDSWMRPEDDFPPNDTYENYQSRSWILDDIVFKHLHPKEYKTISLKALDTRSKRQLQVNRYINQIRTSLKTESIPAHISGRPKHFYSIFRKMLRKNIPIEKIQDLLAIRLVTTSIRNCYYILEIAQHLWKPVKGLYRNYIKNPKANGYRSLHCACQDHNGTAFEIQVRTRDMHHCAEIGSASHRIYKKNNH